MRFHYLCAYCLCASASGADPEILKGGAQSVADTSQFFYNGLLNLTWLNK